MTPVISPKVFLKIFNKELDRALNICTDSRKIKQDDIFFAIKGENFDGHDFVKESILKGAKFAVVRKSFTHANDLMEENLLRVDDPLLSLQQAAYEHLKNMPGKKIAITGSSGKTTVKELLFHILSNACGNDKVFCSKGNFNNLIGLPLSALCVNERHDFIIFEMGMNKKGEIKKLCEIVDPHISLINNISYAHSGNFDDGILGVASAKGEIFAQAKEIALFNDDDLIIDQAKKYNKNPNISFGKKSTSDLRLLSCEHVSLNPALQNIKFSFQNKVHDISLPLLGEHNAMNALAALALAMQSCEKVRRLLVENKIVSIFADFKNIPSRLEVIKKDSMTIVSDCYNANPASMIAGIESIKIFAKNYDLMIGVLGSMGELGDSSHKMHEEIGAKAAKVFDKLFLCGQSAKSYQKGALDNNYEEKNIFIFSDQSYIYPTLEKYFVSGILLFIKGSNSQNLNALVQKIIGK